jgi:RNA-binding protein
MQLTGKQKRHLRSLGNRLKPTVLIGKAGLTEHTFVSVYQAFNTRELIKIKVQKGCPLTEEEVANGIAEEVKAELVQVLGHTILLYRRDDEDPRIDLP